MRKNNKKSRIIMFLCVALVFMGIGYAAYQTRLTITGTSRAGGSFNVEIISVSEKSKSTNVANNTMEILSDKVTANFSAQFTEPGEYIKYNIAVKNKGSIDALLNILLNEENNEIDSQGNKLFLYELKEYDETEDSELGTVLNKRKELLSNEELKLVLTITYNPKAVSFPTNDVTFQMRLNAAQLYSRTSQEQLQYDAEHPEELDFTLDENGIIIGYNKEKVTDENGYVIIGATNEEGSPITGISRQSFAPQSNLYAIYGESGNETDMELYIDYERDSTDFNKMKQILLQMGIEEDTSGVEGTSNKKNALPKKLSEDETTPKLKKVEDEETMKVKLYAKGEIDKPSGENVEPMYIDPDTGEFDEWMSPSISKLDLSGATNLTSIGEESFYHSQLNEIIFPTNGRLTTIGDSAFQSCQLSGPLNLPNTIVTIGNDAFENNQLSGNLSIPASVTSIGEGAFGDMYSMSNLISSISFANNSSLQTIGAKAFSNLQLSGTLTIPSSVTSIGNYAFGSNFETTSNKLTSLVFENNSHLIEIGNDAFRNNQLSGTLTIPSSVTSIGDYAFYGSDYNTTNHLTSLIFENGSHLQTIGEGAFRNNQLSGTLTIPSSVTSIGSSAFAANQISGDLIIPSNVTSLGSGVFSANGVITNMVIPYGIILPSGFLSKSKVTNLIIDVVNIPEAAFSDNEISSLTLGPHVQTIGGKAFANGETITNVTIPSNVITIEDGAFGATNITNLSVDMENIPESAFVNKSIQSLTLGSHVQIIGDSAFAYNGTITSVSIPNSIPNVDLTRLFAGTDVTNLSIDMTNIPDFSFAGKNIETLILGPHVQTIGNNAFNSNQLSGTLTIPLGVTRIGDSAFDNNHISGTLTIPSNVIEIGEYAFNNNQIETLNLGSGITSLGDYAFWYNQLNGNYTLTTINIDMTESTWNSRELPTSNWYQGSPTLHFNS